MLHQHLIFFKKLMINTTRQDMNSVKMYARLTRMRDKRHN